MDLRPSLLDDLGIRETLSWFLREFGKARPDIRIESRVDVVSKLAPLLETEIFRITQEAFNNITKHSGAKRVRFSLTQDTDSVRLEIRDDGGGFADTTDVERAGLGMRSMMERAELSGGDLFVSSRFRGGVSVVAVWPISADGVSPP
jgi:signal transduction histidine kinase